MRNVAGALFYSWVLFCLGILSFQSVYAADSPTLAGEVVSVQGVAFVRPDGAGSGKAIQPAKPGDQVHANDVVNTASNGSIKILLKDKSIVDLGPAALFKLNKFVANNGGDREVDASMPYGTVRGAVTQKITGKGKFFLRTPTATMGVRGTEFVVTSTVNSFEDLKAAIKNPQKVIDSGKSAKSDDSGKKDGKDSGDSKKASTQITVIQGKVDVAQKASQLENRSPTSTSTSTVIAMTAGTQLTTQEGSALPSKTVTLDATAIAKISDVAKIQDNTFSKATVVDVSGGGANEAIGSLVAQSVANLPTNTVDPTTLVPGAGNSVVAPRLTTTRHLTIIVTH